MKRQKNPSEVFHKWILTLYSFRDLLSQLIIRDLKLKYRRSFLGYAWSVLNPLMIMIVMSVVFSKMFARGIENFPAFLISGNILFNFMRESSSNAITSITGNAALLKKTYVPKYIFTLSKITSDFINMLFSFGALILVLIFTKTAFTPYTFLFFLPLIQLYIFCIGLGMFLSQFAVFFRDIQYIWSVITTAWMYLTPLFYPIKGLPEQLQWLISRFNPMFCYIEQFRDLVIYGRMFEVGMLLQGLIIALSFLIIGTFCFLHNKNKFILYI